MVGPWLPAVRVAGPADSGAGSESGFGEMRLSGRRVLVGKEVLEKRGYGR